MAMSVITARVEESDKRLFDDFCSQVGFNVSSAINLFVKAVLREGRIPFSIERDPFYDPVNQEYVIKSVNELRNGKGTAHELIEVADE